MDLLEQRKRTMETMAVTGPAHDEALGTLDLVRRYLRAAELIPPADVELLHPRCHLYGHATELAMKAYLLCRGEKAPRGTDGHDLEGLAANAIACGLQLTDHQRSNVVPNLNTIYFENAASERYSSRYPHPGTHIWLTPATVWMGDLIRSIAAQASALL